MGEQDRAGVAQDMEDAALRFGLQARLIDRMMRRIVQRRNVERRKFHQVANLEHAVGFEDVGVLVEAEFGREHPAMRRVHPAQYFEAHDRGEAAVAQFGLD